MNRPVLPPSLCGDPKCCRGVILVELVGFGAPVFVVLWCPTCKAKRADQAQIKKEGGVP